MAKTPDKLIEHPSESVLNLLRAAQREVARLRNKVEAQENLLAGSKEELAGALEMLTDIKKRCDPDWLMSGPNSIEEAFEDAVFATTTTSEMVFAYVDKNPGCRSSDVVAALMSQIVTRSTNRAGIINSTISSLKNRTKKIEEDADGGLRVKKPTKKRKQKRR